MDRLLILLAILVVTTAVAAWWRARDGRVRVSTTTRPATVRPTEAADLAATVVPTTPLTLVEFSAPDCSPCARTRSILHEASAGRPHVSVVDIDVADAVDLARSHRIMRAPTTLLISADGHVLGRVAGIPRAEELEALLDAAHRDPAVKVA